jgi:hypothetical protein
MDRPRIPPRPPPRPDPYRDRTPSAHEIAQEVAAELSGGWPAHETSPPWERWLQKKWWRVTLWALGIAVVQVIHELIARVTWRK